MSSPLAALLDGGGQRSTRQAGLLKNILRDVSDAVLLVDARGHLVYWNNTAAAIFDLPSYSSSTREATIDAPHISNLFPPEQRDKETLREQWKQIDRRHCLENYETQLLAKNNRVIDAIALLTAIRDERGAMIGYSAIIKDVTQARENEQRLARRNAQLLALNAVAEAITKVPGVVLLLESVLDAVLRVMALGAGCVHLLDDEEEYVAIAAQRGLSPRAAEMLARFELGEGIVGCTAVLGETLIVTDTMNDHRVARQNLSEERIGALATVPLIAHGGVRGVLTLFHNMPRSFTPHEQGMLAAIGRQVGVALEQARLFDEVATARREWEQTFEALADGVSIHAPSGRIRRANKSLAKLFGSTPQALVGVRCCELYHGSPRPRPDCTIMRTVTQREGQSVEIQDSLRGRVLRVTTDPIINAQGRVTGVVCTTRDVTEEKLIEARLIQQERVSAVGEIAAGIAHEVGTPLNIISANIEYLLRHETRIAGRDELEAMREQTSAITTLVRQLLDFARDRSPTFAPVNVNNLIEKTFGLLAHQINRASVICKLSLAPYIPTVDGDAAQLQQVLFNIINNACQAMQQSSAAANAGDSSSSTLTIMTDSALLPTETFKRPHIVITISDTGRGIPDDALPNIFKPFFTANKEGGTGLGLAISSRIIQRHLGLLVIENTSPHGTMARIHLPLSQT